MARKLIEFNLQTDLRGILGTIRVPTLVFARADDPLIPLELVRETAALIPGARFVEMPGTDAYGWPEAADSPATDEIEEFLTGHRRPREPERVLATVLFTDIVDSTGGAGGTPHRGVRRVRWRCPRHRGPYRRTDHRSCSRGRDPGLEHGQ